MHIILKTFKMQIKDFMRHLEMSKSQSMPQEIICIKVDGNAKIEKYKLWWVNIVLNHAKQSFKRLRMETKRGLVIGLLHWLCCMITYGITSECLQKRQEVIVFVLHYTLIHVSDSKFNMLREL